MPGDMRPGTEWGMMWGLSGDVTLWVRFGGRPGLELKHNGGKKTKKCECVRVFDGVEEVGGGTRGQQGGRSPPPSLVGRGGAGSVSQPHSGMDPHSKEQTSTHCK